MFDDDDDNNNNNNSLPVRDKGHRVRRVSSLGLPAFLDSAASTVSLQDEIFANCQVAEGSFFSNCLLHWSNCWPGAKSTSIETRNSLFGTIPASGLSAVPLYLISPRLSIARP